jgi:hypothetical protein
MITTKLKTILTASGCTLVIYDQQQLQNLFVDRSDQFDVIGLIMVPNDIILEVRANAIHEHYQYITLEILQQVRLEEKAEFHDTQLQTLLDICKQIIVRLIADAEFKTLRPLVATRVLENKYDANVIGWALAVDLYYLKNENRDPCL